MLDPENETLKNILSSEGICSEEQLLELEEEHGRTGKPFSELLISFGFVQEDDLLQLVATFLGTDVVDLQNIEVEKSVVDMIDPATVRMYGVIPLSYDGSTLTVASRNPLNYQVADELRFILSKDIRTVVAREEQMARLKSTIQ
jgi:type IV pilus assembly protein PilB